MLLFYTSAIVILAVMPPAIDHNKELVRAAINKVVASADWLYTDLLSGNGKNKVALAPAGPAETQVQPQGATDAAGLASPTAPDIPYTCAKIVAGRGRAVTGDRIQIRLFEPMVAEAVGASVATPSGGAFERLDLGGVYEIDDAGQLALPLLDGIDARGHTLRCIEAAIALRFFEVSQRTGSVSASFAARPPIAVNGAVRSPGTYAAMPGMTLEALLAAAGARVGAGEGASGAAVDLLDRKADLARISMGLTLSIGRMEAALAGETHVRLDEPIQHQLLATLGKRRVATEAEMLRASVATDEAAAAAASAALEGYDSRIAVAEGRLSEIATQAAHRGQRVDEFASLQKKGVATAARVDDLEFGALALERERLMALGELTRLRAERDAEMRRATLAAAERREHRQSEFLLFLQQKQQIEAEIASIEGRLGRSQDAADEFTHPELVVSIRRMTPGGRVQIAGEPSMPVLPGDVVLVGLPSREATAVSEGVPSARAYAGTAQVTR